jgi:hypothetical protein
MEREVILVGGKEGDHDAQRIKDNCKEHAATRA